MTPEVESSSRPGYSFPSVWRLMLVMGLVFAAALAGDLAGWWSLTTMDLPRAYCLLTVPMALAAYALLRYRRIPLQEVIGRCDGRLPWWRTVFMSGLLVTGIMPVAMLIAKAWPGAIVQSMPVTTHLTWSLLLMGAVVGPICEEFIARGMILNRLRQRYHVHRAIVLTAVMFALVHDPVRMVGAFPAGLLFGLLYVRYRSLSLAVLAHAAVNVTALPAQRFWETVMGWPSPVGPVVSLLVAAGCLALLIRLALPLWRAVGGDRTADLPTTANLSAT